MRLHQTNSSQEHLTTYLTGMLECVKVMTDEGGLKTGLQVEEAEEMGDKAMWVLGEILEQSKDFSGENHEIQTKPHLFISIVY